MVVTRPVLRSAWIKAGPFDPIAAFPFDGAAGLGHFQVDRFDVTVLGQTGGKLIGDVEQPSITGVGGE